MDSVKKSSGEAIVTVDVHEAKSIPNQGHTNHDDSTGGEEAIVTVDVHEAKTLINQGHKYLDVRTEEEFKKGHLEKALNIPYMFITPNGRVRNPKFLDQVLAVCGREDELVVGCQSGVRSVYATSDLLQAGFKNVYNMGGGYNQWLATGFPVDQPPSRSTELYSTK